MMLKYKREREKTHTHTHTHREDISERDRHQTDGQTDLKP